MFCLSRQTHFCLLLQIKRQPAAASPHQHLPASSWLLPVCVFAPTSSERAHEGSRRTAEWRRRVFSRRSSVSHGVPGLRAHSPLPGCVPLHTSLTHTRPANLSGLQVDTGACGKAPEGGVLSPCLYKLPLITAEGSFGLTHVSGARLARQEGVKMHVKRLKNPRPDIYIFIYIYG